MNTSRRLLVAVGIAGVSSALTIVVLWSAVSGELMSDGAVIASFRGAAYEDIFGLGFWPTWAVLALAQVAVAAAAWGAMRERWPWLLPALMAAFMLASALDYHSFSRHHSLWQLHRK